MEPLERRRYPNSQRVALAAQAREAMVQYKKAANIAEVPWHKLQVVLLGRAHHGTTNLRKFEMWKGGPEAPIKETSLFIRDLMIKAASVLQPPVEVKIPEVDAVPDTAIPEAPLFKDCPVDTTPGETKRDDFKALADLHPIREWNRKRPFGDNLLKVNEETSDIEVIDLIANCADQYDIFKAMARTIRELCDIADGKTAQPKTDIMFQVASLLALALHTPKGITAPVVYPDGSNFRVVFSAAAADISRIVKEINIVETPDGDVAIDVKYAFDISGAQSITSTLKNKGK